MRKDLGTILGESVTELKKNFWTYFWIIFLFSFIPALIMNLLGVELMKNVDNTVDPIYYFYQQGALSYLYIGLMILSGLLGILIYSALTYNSLYKKERMGLGPTLRGGLRYYFKYLGLTIAFVFIFGLILAIPLTLIVLSFFLDSMALLGIGGVVFFIALLLYLWIVFSLIFSAYVLIGERKGILESMRVSWRITKGQWWRIFGYGLLFMVAAIAMYIPAGIIIFSTSLLTQNQIAVTVISSIMNLIIYSIIYPLFVLIFKNIYLESRKVKK